jgi:hypothetical protein
VINKQLVPIPRSANKSRLTFRLSKISGRGTVK